MTEPIRWRKKVLLVKPEVTYSVDPTLTGGSNAILASNVELRPMEGEDVSRNLEQPFLGAQATIPVGLRAVLTFSTELAGSGTAGTAPAWGPIARACGMAQTIVADTLVAYTPISDTMESVYVKFWIDGVLHALKGARGTGVLSIDAQGVPAIRWTLTGLFVQPTDTAAATPTLTGFKKPLLATTANTPTFTVNAVALVLKTYSLDLGCVVQPRLLVGREEILIVNRAERLNLVVEAVPMATFNPFSLANAQTQVPVSIVHGTVAGNIITVATPTAQVQRLPNYQNSQDILEWPLALIPLPSVGNDQFSITLT